MAGSTYGTLFTITTWGESHGPALGVVIDGCPAGLPLTPEDIQQYLDRRKPGQSRYTTARKESDQAEILSGVFEGKTTGTPISILVREPGPALQGLREYQRLLPAGTRRLSFRYEIRFPGLPGRRPLFRPGDHRTGGGRRSGCKAS